MSLIHYKERIVDGLERLARKGRDRRGTTLLPGLHDFESRVVLAKVLAAQFARWDVPPLNQAVLLGLGESIVEPLDQPLPNDRTVLERAAHLLAIDRALAKRFPCQPAKRDRWLSLPLTFLDEKTPLESMIIGGLKGIKEVRELAESTDEVT